MATRFQPKTLAQAPIRNSAGQPSSPAKSKPDNKVAGGARASLESAIRLGIVKRPAPAEGSPAQQGAPSTTAATTRLRARTAEALRSGSNDAKYPRSKRAMPASAFTSVQQADAAPFASGRTKTVRRGASVAVLATDSPPSKSSTVRFHDLIGSGSPSRDELDGKHAEPSAARTDAPPSAEKQLLAIQSAFTRPRQGEPASWNLALLTTPPTGRAGFIARAEAMAEAVCSSGNNKVPASLIRELFALKHQGTIRDQQLGDALQALLGARFKGEIPEQGMADYLNIVGKAAQGPDERVSAFKPLAKALIEQRKLEQLSAGISAASQYWLSWRKTDTQYLREQIDHPDAAPPKITGASAQRSAKYLLEHLASRTDRAFEKSLRMLGQDCGDDHLSGFIKYFDSVQRPKTEGMFTWPGTNVVAKRVFATVVKVLLGERDTIDQCVPPYERLLSQVPAKSRLYRIAMDTLDEMLAQHGSQPRAKPRPPASSEVASGASSRGQPVHWHSLKGNPTHF